MKCQFCNGTGYIGETGDTCCRCEGSGEAEATPKCYLCSKPLLSSKDIRDGVHWECLTEE